MWACELEQPGRIALVQRPDDRRALTPGQIRVRFIAGGLCGSDMPLFQGKKTESVSGSHSGAPIHEIVGEVVESASSELLVGQRVVGTGGAEAGLRELLIESDRTFIPVPADLSDIEAVSIQSLATVLRAADRLPAVSGRRVAVIGGGPIGLAFAHVLKRRGAGHITMVDPVPRTEVSRSFGADEFVPLISSQWVDQLGARARPEIVIEAAGHQSESLRDCLRAVADGGFVCGFGAADDEDYVLPYREMYERGLTLMSGRTRVGWGDELRKGRNYLLEHRDDFTEYVTHTFEIEHAQEAYDLYASPQPGRLKVALVNSEVRPSAR